MAADCHFTIQPDVELRSCGALLDSVLTRVVTADVWVTSEDLENLVVDVGASSVLDVPKNLFS